MNVTSNNFPTTCSVKVWGGIHEVYYDYTTSKQQKTKITMESIKEHLKLERRRGVSVVFVVLAPHQNAYKPLFIEAGFKVAISYWNVLHSERKPTDSTVDTIIYVASTVPEEERARERELQLDQKALAVRQTEWLDAQRRECLRRQAWDAKNFDQRSRDKYFAPGEQPCFCDYCHDVREGKRQPA